MDYPTARWHEKDLVKYFRDKNTDNFFLSDNLAMFTLSKEINEPNILDCGCACGQLNQLIKKYFKKWNYTGIDLVKEQIDIAKSKYPKNKFICSNIEECNSIELGKFDIVYCVGVFQHVEGFNWLLRKLIDLSHNYVVFDLKSNLDNKNITDINTSSTGKNDKRLLYNIYCEKWLVEQIKSYKEVEKIYKFSYESKPNHKHIIKEKINFFDTTFILKLT